MDQQEENKMIETINNILSITDNRPFEKLLIVIDTDHFMYIKTISKNIQRRLTYIVYNCDDETKDELRRDGVIIQGEKIDIYKFIDDTKLKYYLITKIKNIYLSDLYDEIAESTNTEIHDL